MRKVPVPCPNTVCQYNKHMGGVHKAGMLIDVYGRPLKSKSGILDYLYSLHARSLCCECMTDTSLRDSRNIYSGTV